MGAGTKVWNDAIPNETTNSAERTGPQLSLDHTDSCFYGDMSEESMLYRAEWVTQIFVCGLLGPVEPCGHHIHRGTCDRLL